MSEPGRTVRLALVLEPQPEGGYTVESPALPPFVTEGDTIAEVIEHAIDCFYTVLEFYEDDKQPLPKELFVEESTDQPITIELLLQVKNKALIPG